MPAMVRTAPQTTVRLSLPKGLRRTAGNLARRGASAAARAAASERHTLTAMGAAAALGYIEGSGTQVPKVDALGVAGTYGGLAWMVGRFTKSRVAEHVATGLLAVAVRDMVARSAANRPQQAPGFQQGQQMQPLQPVAPPPSMGPPSMGPQGRGGQVP